MNNLKLPRERLIKATNPGKKVTAKPTDRTGSPKRQLQRQHLVQSNRNGSANPQSLHGHYDQAGIPRKDVHRVRAALWTLSGECSPATEPRTTRQEKGAHRTDLQVPPTDRTSAGPQVTI